MARGVEAGSGIPFVDARVRISASDAFFLSYEDYSRGSGRPLSWEPRSIIRNASRSCLLERDRIMCRVFGV